MSEEEDSEDPLREILNELGELPPIEIGFERLLRGYATLDFETGEIRPVKSFQEWAQWMENASRHICYDEVSGFIVSTVFLGVNHRFYVKGKPLWFETMVFRQDAAGLRKPTQDYGQFRYSTIEEARAGHKAAVEAVGEREISA